MDSMEIMINFTRSIWRIYFRNHTVAPKTLCYDPLSSLTGLVSGLCHIAHDSLYNIYDYNPDDQILFIDPYYSETYDSPSVNIANLPELECILFISFDTEQNVKQVLEKLSLKGIVIVMNECVQLPKEWKERVFQDIEYYGVTRSFREKENNRPFETVRDLKVFFRN